MKSHEKAPIKVKIVVSFLYLFPIYLQIKSDLKHKFLQEIMKDPVVWSVWLSAFGELMMSQFIVMYGPTYLKEVQESRSRNSLILIVEPALSF